MLGILFSVVSIVLTLVSPALAQGVKSDTSAVVEMNPYVSYDDIENSRVHVRVSYRLHSLQNVALCDGLYTLELIYTAEAHHPDFFKTHPFLSPAHLKMFTLHTRMFYALVTQGKSTRFHPSTPGAVKVVLDPPPGAALKTFMLEVWNEQDTFMIDHLDIPICDLQ